MTSSFLDHFIPTPSSLLLIHLLITPSPMMMSFMYRITAKTFEISSNKEKGSLRSGTSLQYHNATPEQRFQSISEIFEVKNILIAFDPPDRHLSYYQNVKVDKNKTQKYLFLAAWQAFLFTENFLGLSCQFFKKIT